MVIGKEKIKNFFTSKVFENYFFMTLLKIFSSIIGIAIYPYLIRTLGKESYGLYVFSLSVMSFFTIFISFGFTLPSIRKIVENKHDLYLKNQVVSSVFTAKCLLTIISTLVFCLLIFFIPKMYANRLILSICYMQVLAELFFPVWYFQAVQKMKIVTCIQLAFRILTIPFIFIFIKSPEQNWIYALIVSLSVILGSFVAQFLLWKEEKIVLRFVPISSLKTHFKDAQPFFLSNSFGTLKEESVTLIIGTFMGMADVALYDLANKIITIPLMLTVNINGALYPKIIAKNDKNIIKKIIRYETWIGLLVIGIIAILGYWIVLFLGGKTMLLSYPLAVILSTSILTWLVVGCYINFLFIPSGHYYFVTRNQIVAFFSYLFLCAGLFFSLNIMTVVAALSLSGFCEMIYCRYLIKKHRLL